MASTRIGRTPVTTAHLARFAASLVSALVASLVGGVVMAVVMVVAFSAFEHTSVLYALRPIGTLFHFGICALWGIVFALAATLLRADRSVGGALILGIVIGLFSQIIDVDLVAPRLQGALWGHELWAATVPAAYRFVGHVAFGLTFVLAPLFARALGPAPPPVA
jgi:hypothetical protein